MKLRIKIRHLEDPASSVFDQPIEIKSDTDNLQLFSVMVKPGVYAFEGFCEEEAFDELLLSFRPNSYWEWNSDGTGLS
jgi:hypothetical protein